MKFIQKDMGEAAEASSGGGRDFSEFIKLSVLALLVVVVVYFMVGMVVELAVSRISVETEKKIFGVMNAQTDSTDPRSKKLESILEKLTSDPEVPALRYSIFVVEEESPNAFAFPGGKIGVTTGLLEMLDDEDDEIPIAFVIGHELGHFKNRDHLRGLGRALGTGILLAVIFDKGGGIISRNASMLMQRKYSRTQETNADHFGVLLVQHAYGKTDGVTKLFESLKESDKIPGWAYMYLTHPNPESRIIELKEFAQTLVE